MSIIPPVTPNTRDLIFKSWEDQHESRHQRRLGAASIGDECERKIWYKFRWAKKEKFDGRRLKLFNRGHREEPALIADLLCIGIEVLDVDPDTKRQWEFSGLGDHLVCKTDAIACGFVEAPKTYHLVEFKLSLPMTFPDLIQAS